MTKLPKTVTCMLFRNKNTMIGLVCLITGVMVVVLLLYPTEAVKGATLVRGQHSVLNPTDLIREKLKSVRILCWVTTALKNLQTRTRFVKATWGKRCDVLLFIGSQEDKNFPVIRVNAPEGRDHLTEKTSLALQYVYEHYRDKADWFLKADDDTYVIMDNLKYFLADFKTAEGLYFGFTFTGASPDGYNSGGGGYVLSQEALKRFYVEGSKRNVCPVNSGPEDMYIGKCMYHLHVKNVNTLDKQNRTRFHAYHPLTHIDVSDSYLATKSAYGYKAVRNWTFSHTMFAHYK